MIGDEVTGVKMPSSTVETTATASTASNHMIPLAISNVSLQTIHGQLDESNYSSVGCIDFSYNSIVAFACQSIVQIVDCKSNPLRTIQSLHGHQAPVTRVKFPRDNSLKLASSDTKSTLILWDVLQGTKLCTFIADSKETKAGIVSFDWLNHTSHSTCSSSPESITSIDQHAMNNNGNSQSILVLYASHLLVLFDSTSGNTMWRKKLSNQSPVSSSLANSSSKNLFFTPSGFSLDPFTESNLVIPLTPMNPSQIQCSFLHTSDIHSTSPLTLKRYHIFVTDLIQPQSLDKSPDMRLGMRVINSYSAFSKPSDDDEDASQFKMEMRQVIYSKNQRNQVAVASSRVVTIIDLNLNEILVTIPLERSLANLIDVWPCEQRNALYTLHKSACVILRSYQKRLFFDDSRGTHLLEPSYKSLASSNCLKLPKNVSVAGFAVSPIEETLIAILLSSGKLVTLRVSQCDQENLSSPCQGLFDVIPQSLYNFGIDDPSIHITQHQVLAPLSKLTVIKSCPPATKSNWNDHRPLVALGTSSGTIQVYDMSTGHQEHNLSIHSSTVRGIDWVSLTTFLSFSYSKAIQVSINSHQKWKTNNEIVLTDLKTGVNQIIRKDKNADFSPIQMIKVSHLKQYFIITFKDEPFEIWDLKKLTLIKIMSKFSQVTCVEWSPITSKSGRSNSIQVNSLGEGEIKNKELLSHIMPPSSSCINETETIAENFIFNNLSNGDLIHYSVDNLNTREIHCIKGDSSHGPLTSIAWKGEQLLLAFADGVILFWDLKKKCCIPKATHKEAVKKIRVGPGKGNINFLVLHKDSCLVLWDLNSLTPSCEIKNILDFDWIASDRPILFMSDGTLRITDLSLTRYSFSINLSSKCDINDINLNWNLLRSSSRFKLIANYTLTSIADVTTHQLLDRCINVALMTGNKLLLKFWLLVSHHLLDTSIDPSFNLLLKNDAYATLQKEALALYEFKKIATHSSGLEMCTEYHLLFKNYQRAVQLLLESFPSGLGQSSKSSPSHSSSCNSNDVDSIYYQNALKACLIASLTDQTSNEMNDKPSSSAEPVIKLVSASLIASGSLNQGVQLLLLIDKISDACRYLQSQGLFKKCAWIAKTCLSSKITDDMVRSCLLQLDQGEMLDELFIHLSTDSLINVLKLLLLRNDICTAALFIILCRKHNISYNSSASHVENDIFNEFNKCLNQHQLSSLVQLFLRFIEPDVNT